ncbi:MAG: glycosyltransferase family 4 protein [Nitrospiraceae bacterium]
MRICLLTPELPPFRYGGIGNYVKVLATGLAQRGHDVVVAGYQLHPEAVVQHRWGRSISVTWQGRFLWRFEVGGLLSAAVALRNLFRTMREEFDIVEAPNWGGHSFLLPRLSCPLVVRVSTPHIDTLTRRQTFADRVIHAAEKRLCRRASLIVAHSRAMENKAAQLYGVKRKTMIIPLGIEPGGAPDFSANETVDILFVGRAEHRKGVDVLLLALDELLEKDPRLTVTFVGTKLNAFVQDTPHLAAILSRIKSTCSTRFRELGLIDEAEKQRLFQQADWAIVPSRFESFGIVAIEAMREGTPVIGSRGSGVEEIAGLTGTSLLVTPGDRESLVMALKQALSLGSHHKKKVMRSVRETFLSRFSADAMVSATEAAYSDVLNGRRQRHITRGRFLRASIV